MKRVLVAIGLALMLVLFAFGDQARPASDCEPSALGTICTTLVANDIVVTLAGREIARIPAPVKTVSVKVPVPGPTQLIPGPVRTIIVPSPVPGPVRTVYVTSPGPVVHSPVPAPSRTTSGPVVPKLTPTPGSATVSAVPSPVVTSSPSPVPGKTSIRFRDRVVKVSVPQAIAISAGLLLLGLILGLAALYVVYRVGEKDGENIAARRGHELLHDLFKKE